MIAGFFGEYRFLSNFEWCKIVFEGRGYSSVEHAYHAAKTTDMEERRMIGCQTTPGRAKRAARKITLRPDWEQIKESVMLDLVRQKFQVSELKEKLLATGDEELVELNTWGDMYWGKIVNQLGQMVGQNKLGKILMQVREEIRSGRP